MEHADVVRAFEETRTRADGASLPSEPGIYAFYLTDGAQLPTIQPDGNGLLYVGETKESLRSRAVDNHLNDEQTGFSTLRRTLGALLKDNLELKAIPRSQGSNKNTYRFEPSGESELTRWMLDNLDVAHCATSDHKRLEKDTIKSLEPPLNIRKWRNPDSGRLMELRAVCAREANG